MILIIPVTIPLIQNIGIEIQRAKNMHKFMSWVYFAIAVANIILTLFLAKAYKGIGAAIGTAISLIIGNGIVMNWFYQTKVGLDIKYFWRQIARLLIPLLVPVVYGIFINKYINLYSLTNFFIMWSRLCCYFLCIYVVSRT